MQKDAFFTGVLVTITLVAVSSVFLLVYNISQKSAAATEEKVKGLVGARTFEIVSVQADKMYIKNTGTDDIKELAVYIDSIEVPVTFGPIAPNAVGVINLPKTGKILKVVSGEFYQEVKTG